MFQKILVPYDGSSFSDKALQVAIDMAKSYGEELLVLNVTPIPGVTVSAAMDIAMAAQVNVDSNDIIEQAKAIVGNADIKIDYIISMGNAAKTILNVAMEQKCGLIVMGNRGLTGLSELLMGSVSSKVVQLAKVPVMVVK